MNKDTNPAPFTKQRRKLLLVKVNDAVRSKDPKKLASTTVELIDLYWGEMNRSGDMLSNMFDLIRQQNKLIANSFKKFVQTHTCWSIIDRKGTKPSKSVSQKTHQKWINGKKDISKIHALFDGIAESKQIQYAKAPQSVDRTDLESVLNTIESWLNTLNSLATNTRNSNKLIRECCDPMRIKGLEALYIESLIKLSSAFSNEKSLERFNQRYLSASNRGLEDKITKLEREKAELTKYIEVSDRNIEALEIKLKNIYRQYPMVADSVKSKESYTYKYTANDIGIVSGNPDGRRHKQFK